MGHFRIVIHIHILTFVLIPVLTLVLALDLDFTLVLTRDERTRIFNWKFVISIFFSHYHTCADDLAENIIDQHKKDSLSQIFLVKNVGKQTILLIKVAIISVIFIIH